MTGQRKGYHHLIKPTQCLSIQPVAEEIVSGRLAAEGRGDLFRLH
jgi:hypothetical protein